MYARGGGGRGVGLHRREGRERLGEHRPRCEEGQPGGEGRSSGESCKLSASKEADHRPGGFLLTESERSEVRVLALLPKFTVYKGDIY